MKNTQRTKKSSKKYLSAKMKIYKDWMRSYPKSRAKDKEKIRKEKKKIVLEIQSRRSNI